MGTMYSLNFNSVAVTAVQDLFQIEAITTPIVIHQVSLSQHTDVGDAAAEALEIQLAFITDDITDDLAAEPLTQHRAALANLSDLAINETSQLTTGIGIIYSEAWNIALPFIWMPPPEMRPIVEVANAFAVKLETTPADSITMHGTCIFEEL